MAVSNWGETPGRDGLPSGTHQSASLIRMRSQVRFLLAPPSEARKGLVSRPAPPGSDAQKLVGCEGEVREDQPRYVGLAATHVEDRHIWLLDIASGDDVDGGVRRPHAQLYGVAVRGEHRLGDPPSSDELEIREPDVVDGDLHDVVADIAPAGDHH